MENEELRKIIQLAWPEWKVCETIGSGAFATVYRASRKEKIIGEKDSAIKVIRIPHRESDWDELLAEGKTEEQARLYFQGVVEDSLKEIRAMDELNGHTNIVNIYDYKRYCVPEEHAWYILIRMELLQKVNTQELDEEQRIRLGRDVCTALSICQKKNIVHRDVSLDNIFVHDGNYKLGDFGVAKILEGSIGGFHSIAGKPIYMAPELYNASLAEKDIDAAKKVDIYSLGILLYRLCHHMNCPFEDPDKPNITASERQEAFRRRVIEGEKLPPPKYASPEFAEIILKACSANPTRRYANADEMLEALQSMKKEDTPPPAPKKKKPVRIAIFAAVFVLLAAGLLLLILPGKGHKDTYHIVVTAPENVYAQNFSATQELLRNRLNIFTKDLEYDWKTYGERIDLNLPTEAFGGQPAEKILAVYLVRPTELFLADPVRNDAIEIRRQDAQITLKEGAIEGIDPAEFGIGTTEYRYLEVILSEDFVSRNSGKISQWNQTVFAQDIHQYESDPYTLQTAASGDGRTYYILSADPEQRFLDLMYFNLTHDPLPETLDFSVDINPMTEWQKTNETSIRGKNQRDVQDITEESVTFSLAAHTDLTDGNKLDLEKAFKAHMDAIGNPYAFGTSEKEGTGFKYVIRTSMSRMGIQVMQAICTTAGKMKVRAGLTETELPFHDVTIDRLDGETGLAIRINDSQKEKILKGLAERAAGEDQKIYLCFGNDLEIPLVAGKAETPAESGELRITEYCEIRDNQLITKPLDQETLWICDLVISLTRTASLPIIITTDQYWINMDSKDRAPAMPQFGIVYTTGGTALETKARAVCPSATVNARGETIEIQMNLYPDESFPGRAAETVQSVYEALEFPSLYAENLVFYLIQEQDTERARIYFDKKRAAISTLSDFDDEEGYVYVHGSFANGRMTAYTDPLLGELYKMDFYRGMTHEETSWMEGYMRLSD